MAYEFKFPDVGEGITEGELVKWRVEVGDVIKEDDVIADVETDKAVVEIPSPTSGTILKLNFKPGDIMNVGDVIVVIGEKGEAVKEEKKESLEEKVEKKAEQRKSVSVIGTLEEADDEVVEKEIKEARKEIKSLPKETAVRMADDVVEQIIAMPKVRRIARELGVDILKIHGTGGHGQVTEEDVRKAKGVGASPVRKEVKHARKYDIYGYVERIPLKGMRKAIAKNMSQSAATIPHVSHVDRVDMTELFKVREHEKKAAEEKGIKLTYLAFIYKAVAAALKEHLLLNSSLEVNEFGEEEIIKKKYFNIGFAVDTSEGLMVPVIKGVGKKSILDIAKEIVDLAEKARERKINLGDMKGGTFTITNYGSIGGMFGTPIINHPESAILGLGRMRDEAVVVNGKVEVRKIMYLTLSFDHRILDGAEAARFMNKVISYLEDPDSLLVEM